MNTKFAGATAALMLLSTTAAQSQEFGVSAGFDVVSEYMSQGFELSDGPALQPWIELSYGGLYAGAWSSNGDVNLLGAERELDYYIGYANAIGSFDYGITYNLYTFHQNSFIDDSDEIVLYGGYTFSNSFYASLEASYGTDSNNSEDYFLTLQYYPAIEGVTLEATAAHATFAGSDWTYWSLGGRYNINDNVSVNLAWNDADGPTGFGLTDGRFVIGVSTTFNLN